MMKEEISKKEKEIKLEKITLEKIIQSKESIKTVNSSEIKEKIDQIKKNYKEYMDKIKVLKDYKNMIDNPGHKREVKVNKVIMNYNESYSKCSEILDKLMANISLIIKDYINFEEFFNVLFIEDSSKKYLDMDSIVNVKYLGNLLKKVLEKTVINAYLNKKIDGIEGDTVNDGTNSKKPKNEMSLTKNENSPISKEENKIAGKNRI